MAGIAAIFDPFPSLGAVQSTIERRAGIPGQKHLPPNLLRLSVGIEAVEDLRTDLDRTLGKAPEVYHWTGSAARSAHRPHIIELVLRRFRSPLS